MPAVTYLSEYEIERFRAVSCDSDVNDLLQELREKSGGDWLVRVSEWSVRRGLFRRWRSIKVYTLYVVISGGEVQVINCATEKGGTLFNVTADTRTPIMNYMLGYVAALTSMERKDG